jgi:transcriptional regulator with XRE-family HTH domain
VIPDPIYKHIGALIKARRKKLGWKQETLADMLRISRGSLANIEIGRQNVLIHKLYQIAAVLQLTPFDLLPQPSMGELGTEDSELPLPDNLKAQQKKQVANLFLQVNTNQKPEKEGSHAKPAKR